MHETMNMQRMSVLYFWKEFGSESDPKLIWGAGWLAGWLAEAGWPAVTGECEGDTARYHKPYNKFNCMHSHTRYCIRYA